MDPIYDKSSEIEHLGSLLPDEEKAVFVNRANLQTSREDRNVAGQEIERNLQRIIRELRDVLPDYETLTVDDFAGPEPIDAVTIGRTVVNLERDQGISIPSGTRITKEPGFGTLIKMHIGEGILLLLRRGNFPETGIRIQPRSQVESEGED